MSKDSLINILARKDVIVFILILEKVLVPFTYIPSFWRKKWRSDAEIIKWCKI